MKEIKSSYIILICFLSFALQRCGINNNMMFKSPKGQNVSIEKVLMQPSGDYRISVDDKLTFTMATNSGTEIVEAMGGVGGEGGFGATSEYIVRKSGKVELPLLGEVAVEGLTVVQFEDTLQRLFSQEYQNPFVQVKITNQRVIVFPGGGADPKVIFLTNSNTTLMEAIAQGGGISERGKSNSIKLMRKEDGVRQIYTIDLSTIDGLKYADLVVQANDYIYVEPSPDLAREAMKDITPLITILSTTLLLINLFK
jgi:polysaccharide export outer membrane protein